MFEEGAPFSTIGSDVKAGAHSPTQRTAAYLFQIVCIVAPKSRSEDISTCQLHAETGAKREGRGAVKTRRSYPVLDSADVLYPPKEFPSPVQKTRQNQELSKAPREAQGRLGILMPGMGAVATTFMAGVEAVRRQKAVPVGSLSQLGTLKSEHGAVQRIVDVVPLAGLSEVVFGGWDIFPDDAFEAASKAGVLSPAQLADMEGFLRSIKPAPGVFDPRYLRNLSGPHTKAATHKRALAEAVIEDIERFKTEQRCSRLCMVWCGSTEISREPSDAHRDPGAFEAALDANDEGISPSQIYAYAALRCGIPLADGSPNSTLTLKAFQTLAVEAGVPIAGRDFKSGQTFLKTALAPALQARALGLRGWFSSNILGNRDGLVLEDPGAFQAKEASKLGVLDALFDAGAHPELYGKIDHEVRINYYAPRGDNKESWDNIDIFGWLEYPMQIKVNFLCRDSILAAPLVLDSALFLDLAARAGRAGIQDWLSFYWKAPVTADSAPPEHDIFAQRRVLDETLASFAAAGRSSRVTTGEGNKVGC